jgi:predicted TIM-barrel fold metal-dependent hydrolase
VQEFNRCVRDGPMICVGELEADRRCNVPEMDMIVERAGSMNVPILQHTWLKVGGNDEGESSPYDVVEIARRHPNVQFVCVHTGGEWETRNSYPSHSEECVRRDCRIESDVGLRRDGCA